MKYRELGKTGLMVSEVGLGGEWLERHDEEEVVKIMHYCMEQGINIIDCWMSEPNVRTNIGKGMKGNREKWIVQGQIGSTRQNGQHVRTRDMKAVVPAFEDMMARFDTDYVDIGMIHFVDDEADYQEACYGPFYDYVLDLKAKGRIRHIGMSTHNPVIAKRAVEEGKVEMLLFSINPAYDMQPPTEDINTYFMDTYDPALGGINPERVALYNLCEEKGVGLTVMKGFAGGRLLSAEASWFGAALTPVQCIHYALTRPAVASILVGFDNVEQVDQAVAYETATEEEKNYGSVLASAPRHAFDTQCTYCGHCKPCPMDIDIAMVNKYYDLAMMQPDVPSSVKEHYHALDKNADNCIGCGNCETQCPFGVKIVERMVKTRELFE